MALRTNATHEVHSYVQNVGSDVHQRPSKASAAAAPSSLTPPLSVSQSKEPKKPTRKYTRTIFTNEQLVELEREFQLDRFLDRSRRITIAQRLSLRERQVKLWFQNRRMKHKKIALKTENTQSAHQPSIGSLNHTPTATASNTHLLVDKTPSLQLSTDQPPQRKLITFADTQRAVQEFLEYAEKLRKLQASNQQPNPLSVVTTAVKSENTAQTFEGNSTTNMQPISPPCSPSRLGNNACDDIDLGFLDHCQEPDLMAWDCSPISQETLSPPFDMDLDYLNNLLNL